jgi:hypothetical protein
MLANDETTLRSFCARLLGRTTDLEVIADLRSRRSRR